MNNNQSAIQENRRAIQSTIIDCDKDLQKFKEQKKELDEEIADHVSGYQESKKINELKEEIEKQKVNLNAKLSQDPDFIAYQGQKESLNLEIKDTKEILSSHVVAWKMNTHEDQVEMGGNLGKEVVITGKLGKVKQYQTNMFSSDSNKEKLAHGDAKVSIGVVENGKVTEEVETTLQGLSDAADSIKKK